MYEITIRDSTPDDDYPDNAVPDPRASTTFRIYIWRNASTSRGATISASANLMDDIVEEYGTMPLSVVLTGDG